MECFFATAPGEGGANTIGVAGNGPSARTCSDPDLVTIVIPVIAIVIAIPVMIVRDHTTISFPMSFKKASPFVTRPDPERTGVRRSSPIPRMPAITPADRIPVSVDPNEVRARRHRAHP